MLIGARSKIMHVRVFSYAEFHWKAVCTRRKFLAFLKSILNLHTDAIKRMKHE